MQSSIEHFKSNINKLHLNYRLFCSLLLNISHQTSLNYTYRLPKILYSCIHMVFFLAKVARKLNNRGLVVTTYDSDWWMTVRCEFEPPQTLQWWMNAITCALLFLIIHYNMVLPFWIEHFLDVRQQTRHQRFWK